MGVDYSHYLMIGIKKDKYDSDAIQNLEENYDVVADGMCGEYYVVGKILMETRLYHSDGFYEVDLKKVKEECDKIQEKFKEDDVLKELGEPKILSFIHAW